MAAPLRAPGVAEARAVAVIRKGVTLRPQAALPPDMPVKPRERRCDPAPGETAEAPGRACRMIVYDLP